MNYELKNIKVLGYTTDFQKCECCGKENLKGTVSILDINSGVVLHFGTTCAANANKYDDLNALATAKKEINNIKNQQKNWIQFANIIINKFKITKHDREVVIKGFLNFMNIPENRLKRYNWEQWS